jgi:DNA-binding NarL/FixJ family response regulator
MVYFVKHLYYAPDWLSDGTELHYLVLFTVGIVLVITIALVVLKEKASRMRAEELLAEEEYVIAALQAGTSGYLLKDLPAPDLASAVQAVYKGIYQLDPVVASKVITSLSRPQPSDSTRQSLSVSSTPSTMNNAASPRPADLTGREVEVLRLIARGATNREIAEQLVISEGTVKNHISNILSRLGLRDRTQAAIYARENGWLE